MASENAALRNSSCERMILDFAEFLKDLNEANIEPLTGEFHARLDAIEESARSIPDTYQDLRSFCFDATSSELDQSLIHRQGRRKPFGYPGDYQIIDWTYTKFDASPTPRGVFWDRFYHRQIAPLAVCDRKDRFGRILAQLAETWRTGPIRVLNVGSGPCREIVDAGKSIGLDPLDMQVLCVDIDPAAVAYAKSLLSSTWDRAVTFHIGSAARLRLKQEFDLIWSAGLFDYLDTRLATSLLRRLWNALADGGTLVIGNFADSHSTKPWIEWCGDWNLIHRSADALVGIALDAGIREECIRTMSDDHDAIGFLYAQR